MRVWWLIGLLKWSLVALGAFLWIMLWFERSPILGWAQLIIIGVLLRRELPRFGGE